MAGNANHELIRRTNLRRVFQLISSGGGEQTRASLARQSGLTAATVSSIVAELIDGRFVVEAGFADSTGGKPAMRVRLDPDHHVIGAVVLNRHTSRLSLTNLAGVQISDIVTLDAVRSVADLTRVFERLAELAGPRLLAVGIEVPGAVDNHVIRQSVQLNLADVDVRLVAAGILDAPVYLINDADAEALREFALRRSSLTSMVSLLVGDGVGAGIVIDGALHRGTNARAGEIGHVRADFRADAPLCRCGNVGCLERVVALSYVFDLDRDQDIDDVDLGALAREPRYAEALGRMADLIASTCRMMSATLDIPTIVLGGALPRLGEEALARVRERASGLVADGADELRLEFASADPGLRFRGAAEHAVRELFGIAS